MDMKKCTKCGETKASDGFYKNHRMSCGLTSKCKTCTKRDVRENRRRNIAHYREYDARRAMRDDRVEARAAYQKTESGKASIRRTKLKYIEANPAKRACHIAVGNAVRDGRLIKLPCEVCGSQRSSGHHDDYNKPLDVRWLCARHHREWHLNNSPIEPIGE